MLASMDGLETKQQQCCYGVAFYLWMMTNLHVRTIYTYRIIWILKYPIRQCNDQTGKSFLYMNRYKPYLW